MSKITVPQEVADAVNSDLVTGYIGIQLLSEVMMYDEVQDWIEEDGNNLITLQKYVKQAEIDFNTQKSTLPKLQPVLMLADFQTAFKHMEDGNIAKCNAFDKYICKVKNNLFYIKLDDTDEVDTDDFKQNYADWFATGLTPLNIKSQWVLL